MTKLRVALAYRRDRFYIRGLPKKWIGKFLRIDVSPNGEKISLRQEERSGRSYDGLSIVGPYNKELAVVSFQSTPPRSLKEGYWDLEYLEDAFMILGELTRGNYNTQPKPYSPRPGRWKVVDGKTKKPRRPKASGFKQWFKRIIERL